MRQPDNASSFYFEISDKNPDNFVFRLYGRLNIHTAANAFSALSAAIHERHSTSIVFDLKGVSHLDDYGAFVLSKTIQKIKTAGGDLQIENASDNFKKNIDLIDATMANRKPHHLLSTRRNADNLFVQLGDATIHSLSQIKFFISFIGSITLSVFKIIKKPALLRVNDTIGHMQTTGVNALPVVALISFLLGLIMAFMSSLQLRQFGANIYVASLVAMAMVSELGPIMTAIIVAGRSGSAYAAEISTMKISEEVDALFTMGFDPTTFLVIPRMIASVIVIPLLTIFSNIFAIAGGLVIGVTMLDLTATSYITQTMNSLKLFEVFWGLSKATVFAVLISGIGCLRGFQAKGGASAVGNAATSAVVTCIFMIVLFDSIFAVVRSYWS